MLAINGEFIKRGLPVLLDTQDVRNAGATLSGYGFGGVAYLKLGEGGIDIQRAKVSYFNLSRVVKRSGVDVGFFWDEERLTIVGQGFWLRLDTGLAYSQCPKPGECGTLFLNASNLIEHGQG